MNLIDWAERGRLPDALIRFGIRRLCRQRLAELASGGVEAASARQSALIAELKASAVAIETGAANAQHYEVPAAFYDLALGPALKYSACWFDDGHGDLGRAEQAMLDLYVERAGLADGQRILDLGCGWGSLSLYLAKRFPNAKITGISNSASQRAHIEARAAERGVQNLSIRTVDVNALELAPESFDRIVSIEMFEHVRNYRTLLTRLTAALATDGALFVHIFCHRTHAYPFETEGDDNWMGRHFFTGGLMPSADTLAILQLPLRLDERWLLSGNHYARTAECWLANLDRNRAAVEKLFAEGSPAEARRQAQRWRMFFMACAELFGYADGREWLVAHYRFSKP